MGLNQLTSDPVALGGLVTDPKNEIAEATGFLLSVSRFLVDMSDFLGKGGGGLRDVGGCTGEDFFFFMSNLD